jgi:hypothetical protein
MRGNGTCQQHNQVAAPIAFAKHVVGTRQRLNNLAARKAGEIRQQQMLPTFSVM